MARKKERVSFHVDPSQLERLRALSAETRVPQSVHVRDALDQYFERIYLERRRRRQTDNDAARAAAQEG